MKQFNYNCTVAERWQSIANFLASWGGKKIELHADSTEVLKYEKECNVELPESFRLWVSFSHQANKIKKIFSYRDYFTVEWLKNHDALSLVLQGEADYYWAVKRENLIIEDPVVTGYYLDHDSNVENFLEQGQWSKSISSFALDYILSYLNPIGGQFSTSLDSDSEIAVGIEEEFGDPITFGDLSIYLGKNILIYTNNSEENWNSNQLKCLFNQYIPPGKLTPILRKLHKTANMLGGRYATAGR